MVYKQPEKWESGMIFVFERSQVVISINQNWNIALQDPHSEAFLPHAKRKISSIVSSTRNHFKYGTETK